MDKHLTNLIPVLEAMQAGHLVLTPSHRTSIQLLDCYGQWRQESALPAVCLTPNTYAIDIWIRRQWAALGPEAAGAGCSILEPIQESMLWQTIIRDSDFGAGLVNKKTTARSVQEAWRLAHLWNIPFTDIGRLIQFQRHAPNQDDLGAFLAWVGSFETFCRRHSLVSLSPLVEKVTQAIPAFASTLPSHTWFVGFRNPPPLYDSLIRQLGDACDHSEHFSLPTLAPDVQVTPCLDSIDEISRAATWAKTVLAAAPDARIGIICPNLQQQATALQRLFNDLFYPDQVLTLSRNTSPLFSVPVQQPLGESPLVNSALAVLALNDTWIDTLTFCRLLRSPFLLAAGSEQGARAALEFALRDAGELKTRLARVRELAGKMDKPFYCETLADALMILENQRRQLPATMTAIRWCELFESQLASLGWPGDRPLNHAESSQYKAWSNTLKHFKQSSHWYGALTLHQALGRLQQLVATIAHADTHEPAPIQVLSPTEADGLIFSHTWMMGLTEQHWPPAASPSPFIPLVLQQQAGIPGSDIKQLTDLAQQQLLDFRDHTINRIVFSYACQQDDLQLKPAGMLNTLVANVPEQPAPSDVVSRHPAVLAMAGQDATEFLADAVTVAVLPDESIRGGTTLLADQADCPFRAFARHRLDIDSLPAPSIGLPGNVLGSLLHEVMEIFWQGLGDQQQLVTMNDNALDALVTNAVTQALSSMARFHPHTMTHRFLELESRRLKNLLATWLEEEKKRGTFRVLSREQRLQWQHAGLSLRLRIDRLDEKPDGNLVIVDYKSSKGSEIKWTDPRQTEPQLMLYMLAVEAEQARQVDGLFIAQIHVEDTCYKGISNDNDIYPRSLFSGKRQMPEGITWDNLKQSWQQSLTGIANQFLAGYVAVDPKSVASSCQWCDLGGLCRINDEVQA